ncbi:MAG: DUF1800 domain-containing protein [Chloroflexi bacterium]|nr:DUF1800 domain-containing protein [Chloroflexota bacterium]
MAENNIALFAHLMRRAGFGASRTELEELASKDYEAVVEDLLHPEKFPDVEEDVLRRYYPELTYPDSLPLWVGRWMYRMVGSKRPLEEKIALFWHHVFATAWYKAEHTPSNINQIELFRRVGLSDMRTILIALARDPSMNYWLDNCENHSAQPNENWGRELLELFSMGVGNYTEDDIKNAAHAFTGWTFTQPIPLYPYGLHQTEFVYNEDDHDDSEKTFLGETGRFNGEDIIDIIVKQPASARFISRHLYNFFVADEQQVPAWELEPPQNPEAIETLVAAYFEFNGDIRSILRVLFNSDFFKEARFKKVKSPAELVAGTIKLVGTHQFPELGLTQLGGAPGLMGQELMNPPTVEGWHTGKEWIDGGTLNERINFAVNQLSDVTKPGIKDIIDRLGAEAASLSPEEFVNRCLDLVGPIDVGSETRAGLLKYAASEGALRFGSDSEREQSAARIGRMLQLIAASREYQFA